MSENHYAEFSECSMKPQEVLEYVSGPIPVPEEGEVLVRMKAAPINPADINFVQGVYGLKPVLPHSRAGLEGCGVVQESRAEGFREGDVVILLRGVGSWSEYVAVPSVNVMKLPVKVDPVQAAMLKVNPLTALRMLEGFVSLEPGDWLVQNAANSGVGRCIIQLAREMGVKTVNFVEAPGGAGIRFRPHSRSGGGRSSGPDEGGSDQPGGHQFCTGSLWFEACAAALPRRPGRLRRGTGVSRRGIPRGRCGDSPARRGFLERVCGGSLRECHETPGEGRSRPGGHAEGESPDRSAHAGRVRFPGTGGLAGAECRQFRSGKVHYSTGP